MRVGFIGLGTMGGRMAANLLEGGFKLTVCDKRPQAAAPLIAAGARAASTPREAAALSDVIFTSLPEPADVEQVIAGSAGVLEGLAAGSACFDLSTNSPATVKLLHEICARRRIDFLDAPVSGGPRGAETRRLAIWVGGYRDAFDRHKNVLDAIGDQARYIGPIGSATIAKLVHNFAGYIMNRALAEVFTMGVKAGVDPLTLWEAVRQGALGRIRTFDALASHFLPGKFDPADFALRLAHKDVRLATEVGREMGVPMPMGDLALEELSEALDRGWGERDSRAAMLLQEERAGVRIEVDPKLLREALEKDRGGSSR